MFLENQSKGKESTIIVILFHVAAPLASLFTSLLTTTVSEKEKERKREREREREKERKRE
jgi:hypothetical protein